MFRGFYTAASGMLTQQRRTEMLANNLANMNTPGYKADQASVRAFPELLLDRIEKQSLPVEKNSFISRKFVGPLNTGAYMQEIIPNFQQGDLTETNVKTDLALRNLSMPAMDGNVGNVFFTIENPNGGTYYTRNGNFTMNGEGFLTTSNGYYVLDQNGNRIQLENDQFRVTDDGWIEQNGEFISRVGIGFSNNPQQLRKVNEGYFETIEGGTLPSAYENGELSFQFQQGHLERSNVDASQTMTEMLSAYRTFEANQKVLQAYDRSMEKAANEIGKI